MEMKQCIEPGISLSIEGNKVPEVLVGVKNIGIESSMSAEEAADSLARIAKITGADEVKAEGSKHNGTKTRQEAFGSLFE
ncbi:hypothetical protein [Enterococcus sp. LJL90]